MGKINKTIMNIFGFVVKASKWELMFMEKNKKEIIANFNSNVKGNKFDSKGFNKKHDGAEGHWLEIKMGITPNGDNEPDMLGYEMKKDTAKKTTFGDWSPDIALWKKEKPYNDIPRLNRDLEFLKYFGKPNALKNNRLSWSGEPSPKIDIYNKFGQILRIDRDNNILAYYAYSKDTRSNKAKLIPQEFQREDLLVAKWSKEIIKEKLERKFNDKGWFKCYKNSDGVYTSIAFGKPINYSNWIKLVKSGVVFFDSGMHAGNSRPYASWRANNDLWNALITETY